MKKNTTYGRLACGIVLLCAVLSFASAIAQDQRYHRVQVQLGQSDIKALREKGLEVDHFHYDNGVMTAEISDRDLSLIKTNGFKAKVLIKNLSKRIHKLNRKIDRKAAREGLGTTTLTVPTPDNFSLGSMGGFHTIDEIVDNLDRMVQLYPNLITAKSSIGTTSEGRPIYMLRISDNPGVDEDETEILFTALHHAREPITISQTLFFMWHLLENYETDNEVKTLVDNTDIFFVPYVNPDGYAYNQSTNPNGGGYWRKNRSGSGTDPNRNYGYEWGYDNTGSSGSPSSDTYRGASAFSERETRAMRDLCNQHEFVAALNYHSYSNLLIYPWGYRSNYYTPSPDREAFRDMSLFMTEVNNYAPGTANQTVGYVVNGSSDDWMYGEQGSKPKILAMTPEVGSSFWPASSQIIPLCNESYDMNIKLLQMMSKYAKITPVDPDPIVELSGDISYNLERLSYYDAGWTVSLSSSSGYVVGTGTPKEYNNLDFRGDVDDKISFTLSSTTPKGTQIPFTLNVDNGEWVGTAEVVLTYNGDGGGEPCEAPRSLQESGVTSSAARLSWAGVAGAENYDVDYKESDSERWVSVVSGGTSTSASLDNLKAETGYDWRVRANCGDTSSSGYSTSGFTTLPDDNGGGCQSDEDKVDNDSRQTAPSISLEANIKGLIDPVGDSDYYRFTLSSKTTVNIDLSNLAGDYDMRLLNSYGFTLATSQLGGTSDENISTELRAGDYYIRIYGYGGAYSSEQCYALSLSSDRSVAEAARALSLEELGKAPDALHLHPNPVKDVLYIDPVGLQKDEVELQVVDMSGVKVFSSRVSVSKGGLDVSHLSSGTYFIKLTSGGEVKVQRFVKK